MACVVRGVAYGDRDGYIWEWMGIDMNGTSGGTRIGKHPSNFTIYKSTKNRRTTKLEFCAEKIQYPPILQ